MVEHTMDVSGWLRKQLEEASPDLLRAMIKEMAEALMGADADVVCGAGYGERSPERVNRRNGYRERDWDTRVGSIELAVPKLREGSYFPDWLLQPRRRAEHAFVSVIADAYLAGVSTRRVEKLVQQLGVERMSKSQVSRLAKSLDQIVEDFRTRPLDGAPYPYVTLDALVVRCREGGRTVNVCVVHAVAVNRDGFRESLPASTSSPQRTAPPGSRSSVASSPAASRASSWSARTPTPDWSTRSPQRFRVRPGSAAAPTSCATCSPGCPRAPSRSSRRWCGRS